MTAHRDQVRAQVRPLVAAHSGIRLAHFRKIYSWLTCHHAVGEPINPEAWKWYYEEVGNKRCPIVDTWWQTETGGIMITPLATDTDQKPGAAMRPYYGVEPVLLDSKGNELMGNNQHGVLCIRHVSSGTHVRVIALT